MRTPLPPPPPSPRLPHEVYQQTTGSCLVYYYQCLLEMIESYQLLTGQSSRAEQGSSVVEPRRSPTRPPARPPPALRRAADTGCDLTFALEPISFELSQEPRAAVPVPRTAALCEGTGAGRTPGPHPTPSFHLTTTLLLLLCFFLCVCVTLR